MTEHDSPLIPEWDELGIEESQVEPLDADADEEGFDG